MFRCLSFALICLAVVSQAAEKPLVITGKDHNKTFEAKPEQPIEIRLTNDIEGAGWEGPEVRGESVVAVNPKRTMNCDEFEPKDKDNPKSTLGVYIYRYTAVKAGTSALKMRQLAPSGPIPMPRDATKKIAEFGVTIDVK